jgi:hypothetical protein
MNSNPNSTKAKAEDIGATFGSGAYANVFKEGWERAVKVGKTSLDLAVVENAEALASYEKVLKVPTPFLFDLAGRALRGYVTFQKSLLDLAAESSSAAIKTSAEQCQYAGKVEAEDLQQSLDCTTPQTDPASDSREPGVSMEHSEPDSVQLRMLAKEIVDLYVIFPPTKPTVQ